MMLSPPRKVFIFVLVFHLFIAITFTIDNAYERNKAESLEEGCQKGDSCDVVSLLVLL